MKSLLRGNRLLCRFQAESLSLRDFSAGSASFPGLLLAQIVFAAKPRCRKSPLFSMSVTLDEVLENC